MAIRPEKDYPFGTPHFITQMDWELLKQQKHDLLKLQEDTKDEAFLALEGIINLLIELQDYAVDICGIPETEVFRLTCSIRADIENSIPVGKGKWLEPDPDATFEYRWIGEEDTEEFQILVNGEWLEAQSIDFEF